MRSIRLKLWTAMMTIVVLALLLLWLFQIVFLEKFYINMRISEIKDTGYSIVKELNNLDSPETKDKLDEFSYNHNLNIEIFDYKGNIVYFSMAGHGGNIPMMMGNGRNSPMMMGNVRSRTLYEVLDNKEVALTLAHQRFGNKLMMIGIPITMLGNVPGALFMSIPLAPVEEAAHLLKKQLIYITLILLTAASVISFLISKTLTKPILEINNVSKKIASGDFTHAINVKSKDEIGKLAKTINYMGHELSKIERLRKEFIANVSHELRTPLSIIRGYAETIRDASGSIAEKREKHLEIIIDESARLSRIVDDVLNLSQIQAGYMNLEIRSFSINQLIQQVIKRYEVLSEKTFVGVSMEFTKEYMVKADLKRIEQVLYNLINNGINYTPKGGKVTINLIETDNAVGIEVKDNGPGIPEEDIQYIWDRYYMGAEGKERKAIGTGLGLAIVKSILEAHDAVYGVESKKGLGTTFWFELKKA